MANRSITSVNALYMLSVAGLFTIPQQLQGYAADDIFDTESVAPAEISMGLDGKLSSGFVPVPVKQSIMLQANSDSIDLFEAWYAAQQAAKEVFRADALVNMSSVGRSYVLTNGVLTDYMPMASAKKVLQPRRFSITWESVIGAPL